MEAPLLRVVINATTLATCKEDLESRRTAENNAFSPSLKDFLKGNGTSANRMKNNHNGHNQPHRRPNTGSIQSAVSGLKVLAYLQSHVMPCSKCSRCLWEMIESISRCRLPFLSRWYIIHKCVSAFNSVQVNSISQSQFTVYLFYTLPNNRLMLFRPPNPSPTAAVKRQEEKSRLNLRFFPNVRVLLHSVQQCRHGNKANCIFLIFYPNPV